MDFFSRYMAIIYDSCTALSYHCYLTLTGHFIFNDAIARCKLSFLELNLHCNKEIASLIKETLNEDFEGVNVTSCTSDNAKNMVVTAASLQFVPCWMHCVCHSVGYLRCNGGLWTKKFKRKNF